MHENTVHCSELKPLVAPEHRQYVLHPMCTSSCNEAKDSYGANLKATINLGGITFVACGQILDFLSCRYKEYEFGEEPGYTIMRRLFSRLGKTYIVSVEDI